MARTDLPPPLPPGSRTVGQLVAEAIRAYGQRFWRALPLGIGPALTGLGYVSLSAWPQLVWALTFGALAQTVSYIGAVVLTSGRRPDGRALAAAVAVGLVVFVPVPVLSSFLLLPAAAWLGLVALAVPAAVIERLGPADALRKGVRLARADYVHSFGTFAALLVVLLVTTYALFFLLRGQAETTLAAAGLLSLLVISPLIFLGAALLYEDQAARLDSGGPRPKRRSDADVHPAVDADRPGRPDAEVEPRAAARGEP